MKVQNKSCKSKGTIKYCLLTCFIVLPLVNCSPWFFGESTSHNVHRVISEPDTTTSSTTSITTTDEPSQDFATDIPVNSSIFDNCTNLTICNHVNNKIDPINGTSEETCNSTEIPEPPIHPPVLNIWTGGKCNGQQFNCHSKRWCIDSRLICNGINDCDDGSDEFSCSDRSLLLDPQCQVANSQYKTKCGCVRTDYNDAVCVKEEVPFLVFATLNDLYKVGLPEHLSDGKVIEILKDNFYPISAFEYSTSEDLLIWLDPIENKIFTGKVNLEQKSVSPIYGRKEAVTCSYKIHGFVYDYRKLEIIWIDDTGIKSVEISSSDYSPINETKIITTFDSSYEKPALIAFDGEKRSIFWVNYGADSMISLNFSVYIERIDIMNDKPFAHKIVDKDILRPVGLIALNKVYWIDGLYRTLNSVEYDGSDRQTLYASLPFINEIISIDAYGNYLYFTNKTSRSIQRVKMYGEPKSIETYKYVPYGFPLCVKIIKPYKQCLSKKWFQLFKPQAKTL